MLVTMTTPGYEEWYKILMASLKRNSPRRDIFTHHYEGGEGLKDVGAQKPLALLEAARITDGPLVWIDADCVVLKALNDLEYLTATCDILILHRDEPYPTTHNNGVVGYNNTPRMRDILSQWASECALTKERSPADWANGLYDQGALQRIIERNAHKVDIKELPEKYNWIRKDPDEHTVIWHMTDWKRLPGMKRRAREAYENSGIHS